MSQTYAQNPASNRQATQGQPPSILVSGASGFVGSAVVNGARACGMQARPLRRRFDGTGFDIAETTAHDMPGAVATMTGWEGIDAIVHCAGRAHVMKETAENPLEVFRASNVAATIALARQAVDAGIARFVFLSSIKVNGELTTPGAPFRPDDPPSPTDPYGVSKHEAELALRRLSIETGLQVVVIRPVLVYGPGVRGNFLSLMHGLQRRIPLPFRRIHNRRSLVGISNLVDLILTAVRHPNASGETFLVSDDDDLSTPMLLERTAIALGTEALLVPVPVSVLRFAAAVIGRRKAIERLCGTLQVDIQRTRAVLGWSPPVSVDAELGRTARHFLTHDDSKDAARA
jgi:UDP-N-acetyl-alpha-D-quinovosamine dehydrogenase